ncbi:unnamed protein product [Rangifer tarandus platyrhynchus]|uniref:Uncharacterized protein n=2 Tax=Rangifer tarandus platyrhynchus TaxID=3082113 RepID=A0ABN8ZV85_RANTA|nr:unnamed protein product [Rangifer tarandus platyrhynchus]CAI9711672.1 unnamed protein product [Rangifer tarandus platyrhynchus]
MVWYGPVGRGGLTCFCVSLGHYEGTSFCWGCERLSHTGDAGVLITEVCNDMRASLTVPGYQWEMIDYVVIVQVFLVLLLLDRIVWSFKERFFVKGDKEHASSSSALAIVKSNTLSQYHADLEENKHSGLAYDLNASKPARRNSIGAMVRHGTKAKPRCSDQEQPMSETARDIQALYQEQKAVETQVQEAKASLNLLPATEQGLKLSIVNFMACVKSQVSLQEDWLKMKEMAASLGGKDVGENLELEEQGNKDQVDDHAKGSRKKWKEAAMSRKYLSIHSREKKQFYNIVKKEKKAQMIAHHKVSQAKKASIERPDYYPGDKGNNMTEAHHPKGIEHLGILAVKTDLDLQHKVQSSEADGLVNLATEELKTYRRRFQDLELQLERTIFSYQWQILTLKRKAIDDWLQVRKAERSLLLIRQEVTGLKQRIRESAVQLQLLEVDFHVFNHLSGTFGRDNCFSDLCTQDGAVSEVTESPAQLLNSSS